MRVVAGVEELDEFEAVGEPVSLPQVLTTPQSGPARWAGLTADDAARYGQDCHGPGSVGTPWSQPGSAPPAGRDIGGDHRPGGADPGLDVGDVYAVRRIREGRESGIGLRRGRSGAEAAGALGRVLVVG